VDVKAPPDAKPKPRPQKGQTWAIKGEVIDPAGAPVPGAEIVVLDVSNEPSELAAGNAATDANRVNPEHIREIFSLDPEESVNAAIYTGLPALPGKEPPGKEFTRGESGDDGKFSIEAAKRGPFRLVGSKEGVGRGVATGVWAGGEPVTLRLGPAAVLSGKVVNAVGGVPIEGAVLVVRSGGTAKEGRSIADGTFSIAELPPGKYTLVAGATGFAPVTMASVEVPSPVPVDVVLGGGFTVRVNVTAYERPTYEQLKARGKGPRPPGPPVEGAVVILYHSQTDSYRTAMTGPDGVARLERLGLGNWRIGARKDGFNVGGCTDVRFKPGSPPEESRDVKLYPAYESTIRVTDENGAAIRNARVFTGGTSEDYDEKFSKLVGRTDDEGKIKFAFDDTVPWKSVLWVIPEEGGAAAKLEPEGMPGEADQEDEKVVIRPGRPVSGVVKDQKGRPVKDMQVTLEVTDKEADLDLTLLAYTDASGVYKFPGVPFGETTLEVDSDGETETVEVDEENKESPLLRDFKITVDEEEK
jgi:hypothetical protein